ncbi:hypothetical protein [Pelagibius marinus]|uniref:hypothetical protein n=1 Tax=Pelagibius marinus TaxID=2762760 RepID=UPI0018725AF5|nr:hypothetical protein [Pelagibius marinus]
MQRPLNIIDLAITEEVSDDAAEVARRLDLAADLVEEFAEETAIGALDSLLAAATAGGKKSAAEIGQLADDTAEQTEILHSEIERFLAVSAGQRPN